MTKPYLNPAQKRSMTVGGRDVPVGVTVDRNTVTWRPVTTLALCVIGLGLSAYTLWVHYHPGALACLVAGPIDCQAVLTSAQSVVFGIPVPFFGIAFFLGLGAFCLPAAWRSAAVWVHWSRLAVVIVGIGSVIYLVSTELFAVKKICLWCTGVHLVTFALFVIIAISTPALVQRGSVLTNPKV
jgi:uncharacterized membrane protein